MPEVTPTPKAAKLKKSSKRTDRDECDRLISLIIRKRDGRCMRCGKNDGRLECSHIIPREKAVLRCHPLNLKTLCHACHRWWHAYSTGMVWIVESGVRTAAEIEWLLAESRVTGVKAPDWHEMRKLLKIEAKACGAI